MTKRERKHFTAYVRVVARRMWLGSWTLNLCFEGDRPDEELDDDTAARVVWCRPEYREASIVFADSLFKQDARTIRETVVHELIHLHHAHVERDINQLLDTLAPAGFNVAQETTTRSIEEHVTVMARLIDHTMPKYQPLKG